MKFAVDKNGKTLNFEVEDDFRMDELYANLNKIPESVSDEELHSMMSRTREGILGNSTGKSILFKDNANSSTTVRDVGINESEMYTYDPSLAESEDQGGRDE